VPDQHKTPAEHADAAAEAIRSLTHATLSGGYRWPSDVYATLGALERVATMLPQALRQAATWLEQEHDAGRVGHDHPKASAGISVEIALGELDVATEAATSLRRALAGAHEATAHLTGKDD
jgi:hypothetical protein